MDNQREVLLKKYAAFIDQASEDSIKVLTACLDGAIQMEQGGAKTYINGVLNYQSRLLEEGGYEARITLNPFSLNVLNITHGGILATFADTAMGTYVAHLLPEGQASVTSEMSVHFIAPAKGEQLIAKTKIVHRGNRLWVMACDVFDDQDTLVATSTGSFFVIKRR